MRKTKEKQFKYKILNYFTFNTNYCFCWCYNLQCYNSFPLAEIPVKLNWGKLYDCNVEIFSSSRWCVVRLKKFRKRLPNKDGIVIRNKELLYGTYCTLDWESTASSIPHQSLAWWGTETNVGSHSTC